MWELEEADETDKTLMAGEHQADPILIHLFVIIMTSSNKGGSQSYCHSDSI